MKRLLPFSLLITSIIAIIISCAKEEPKPEPIKYSLTVSAGDGGNVSSTGGSYNAGSEVTITATPNSEYVFSGWSNGSTDNPIKVTVNSNQTLTANFTKRKYALSITIEGEGTVTEEVISSGKDYDSGTVVRLTAVPSEGWRFDKWIGAIESTEAVVQVEMNEAKEVTATFTKIEYELSIKKIGEGNIEIIDITESGDDFQRIKLIPEGIDDFYHLAWLEGGIYLQDKILEIELNENKQIEVFFISQSTFSIDILGNGELTISEIGYKELSQDYFEINTIGITVKEESVSFFRGWGGLSDRMGGVESNQTNNLSINLEERGFRIRAYFSENIGTSKIDYEIIKVPEDENIEAFFNTIVNPNTVTYFSNSTGEYIIFMPSGSNVNNPNSFRNTIEPGKGIIFKKIDGFWKFHKIDGGIKGWGFRNFKQFGNDYIVVGDGNEIGPEPQDWEGDLYFGTINGEEINWTRVTSDNEMLFYHGTSGGDLNNDGLIDVGGTGSSGFRIFFQNPDGSFTMKENIIEWTDEISDYIGGTPFSWEFEDVFGDAKSEIIMADYGAGDPNENDKLNNISVWKFDEEKQKFTLHFLSNESNKLFSYGRGATKIVSKDINNDGIKDLIIAGEDKLRSMETWIGNGDGTFNAKWSKTFNSDEFELGFAEFFMMDVNKDGYVDLVLNGLNKNPQNIIESDDPNVGINFNSSIWINHGDGTFYPYSSKLLQDDFGRIAFGIPYMKEGSLHFFGSFNPSHLIDLDKREITIIQQDISFDLN